MGTINGARKDYIALGPVSALDGPVAISIKPDPSLGAEVMIEANLQF